MVPWRYVGRRYFRVQGDSCLFLGKKMTEWMATASGWEEWHSGRSGQSTLSRGAGCIPSESCLSPLAPVHIGFNTEQISCKRETARTYVCMMKPKSGLDTSAWVDPDYCFLCAYVLVCFLEHRKSALAGFILRNIPPFFHTTLLYL